MKKVGKYENKEKKYAMWTGRTGKTYEFGNGRKDGEWKRNKIKLEKTRIDLKSWEII